MRLIPLTQDKFALVDDEDYDWLMQFRWFACWHQSGKTFYAERVEYLPGGKSRTFYMHREILGLKHGDKRQGDHIHHNTLDNRHSQIRIVTGQRNQFNRRNAKGYHLHKRSGEFKAQIQINKQSIYLGRFKLENDARSAYLAAKEIYHV